MFCQYTFLMNQMSFVVVFQLLYSNHYSLSHIMGLALKIQIKLSDAYSAFEWAIIFKDVFVSACSDITVSSCMDNNSIE